MIISPTLWPYLTFFCVFRRAKTVTYGYICACMSVLRGSVYLCVCKCVLYACMCVHTLDRQPIHLQWSHMSQSDWVRISDAFAWESSSVAEVVVIGWCFTYAEQNLLFISRLSWRNISGFEALALKHLRFWFHHLNLTHVFCHLQMEWGVYSFQAFIRK